MRLQVTAHAFSGPSFAAEDPSDMLITIEAEDVRAVGARGGERGSGGDRLDRPRPPYGTGR